VRERPYWTLTKYGRHVGYHKRSKGDTYWVARIRTTGGSYRQHRLARADDFRAANGDDVLSYEEAWDAATAWFRRPDTRILAAPEGRRGINEELNICPIGSAFTIGHALKDYVEWKRLSAAPSNLPVLVSLINFHIVPRLAPTKVEDFSVELVTRFTREVMETPPRRGKQAVADYQALDELDPEALRKRKKSVNTVLSILRVSLRMAWENGKVETERPWRCIRRFPNVDAPRALHLSRTECRLLLEKCRPDMRRLVLAALYTGCRVTELLRMQCCHVGRDGYGVYVTAVKSHRPRFVFLPDEGMAWFLSLSKGRDGSEPLFINDVTGRPFGKYKHLFREAVRAAGLPRGFGFHGLRHTYASQLVQAGSPILVVADQLGHANAMTVLKTYGHLSPQIRESEVRQRFTSLSAENSKLAKRQKKKLKTWRASLHGGDDWRTYAKITDTKSRRNTEL
jgi:integrase